MFQNCFKTLPKYPKKVKVGGKTKKNIKTRTARAKVRTTKKTKKPKTVGERAAQRKKVHKKKKRRRTTKLRNTTTVRDEKMTKK